MRDVDIFGVVTPTYNVKGMLSPVLCRCGQVYDLCAVPDKDIIARHADCDVFTTPCCKRQADTRDFKSSPDYTRLGNDGKAVARGER